MDRVRDARRINLHDLFNALDPALPPFLRCGGVKPTDPFENVDRAHVPLRGECRIGGAGDAIGKWRAVLATHD